MHKLKSNQHRRTPPITHLLTAAKTGLSTQVRPPSCFCVVCVFVCVLVWQVPRMLTGAAAFAVM